MEILRLGSKGTIVELLQSILNKLGLFSGNIDGVFGTITENAVKTFQRRNRLSPDGIVGNETWRLLYPYIYGYQIYTIKNTDTLYSISNNFSTSINRILMANPSILTTNLQVGEKIIVPFGNIVPTNISYTYRFLQMNLFSLKALYPFLEIGSIGNSVMNKSIPYIKFGIGSKEVFYNASFHANEWITSPVLMKFLERLSQAYTENQTLYGYNIKSIYEDYSIYIVPMVNPDGVDLVTGDIDKNSNYFKNAQRISSNFSNIPFTSGWKANIQGIDLNLQFPANWDLAREIKFSQGFNRPAPRDYVGPSPLSSPESIAIYNFTLQHNFRLILAYHTQGRIIYWRYLNYLPNNSAYIAERFSNSSGYALAETPYNSSFAGYKDWFIQNYNRPGYTIEVGLGINPLPISQFNTIYAENEGILILGAILS